MFRLHTQHTQHTQPKITVALPRGRADVDAVPPFIGQCRAVPVPVPVPAPCAWFAQPTVRRSEGLALSPPGLRTRSDQLDAQMHAILRASPPGLFSCQTVADMARGFFDGAVETGCVFAVNALALTAQARDGQGPWTGWGPRERSRDETYLEALKDAAIAAAVAALPVGAAFVLARLVVRPVASAIGRVLLGAVEYRAEPAEVFFPDPSPCRADGSPRSADECRAAWLLVRRGREKVRGRQAGFVQGSRRDMASSLAHPLTFVLQGFLIDQRAEQPGILTAGAIALGSAAFATVASETVLGLLKKDASLKGIDGEGHRVDLRLFERHGDTAGKTFAERLAAAPAVALEGIREQYGAVAGGASGVVEHALAVAAELARGTVAAIVLNGAAAPIDSVDAQFTRPRSDTDRDLVNAGFGMLSYSVATGCAKLVSRLLGNERAARTGRRELAAFTRQFRARWMSTHARRVVALYRQAEAMLRNAEAETTIDRVVFDAMVAPMMRELGAELAGHPRLYPHAGEVRPAKLRVEMLADHGNPDESERYTIYLDRLLKLPKEHPQLFAAPAASRQP